MPLELKKATPVVLRSVGLTSAGCRTESPRIPRCSGLAISMLSTVSEINLAAAASIS